MNSYSVSDFLISLKQEIKKLQELYQKSNSPEKRIEIKEQIEWTYKRGLHCCIRFKREVPTCVRKYFLGCRGRPNMNEILSEIQELNFGRDYAFVQRVVRITIPIFLTILTILLFLQ